MTPKIKTTGRRTLYKMAMHIIIDDLLKAADDLTWHGHCPVTAATLRKHASFLLHHSLKRILPAPRRKGGG